MSPAGGGSRRPLTGRGFTLIEVLVVVAIIALLVAILLPSLAKAREQARTVVCLGNMSNLPKAVLNFAAQHKGYGQLIPNADPQVTAATVRNWDPSGLLYAYDEFSTSDPKLKMWPVAYAKELGFTSLKHNNQYFLDFSPATSSKEPGEYFARFGRRDVLLCPSDKALVNFLTGDLKVAPLSYGINEDILGASGTSSRPGGFCYRFGSGMDPSAPRLNGKLDSVARPSEVAFFADAGRSSPAEDWRQMELISIEPLPDESFTGGKINGPYLANCDAAHDRLARGRHSKQGALAVAMVDGSGKIVQPVGGRVLLTKANGGVQKLFPRRYAPRVRVSPYSEIGKLGVDQP